MMDLEFMAADKMGEHRLDAMNALAVAGVTKGVLSEQKALGMLRNAAHECKAMEGRWSGMNAIVMFNAFVLCDNLGMFEAVREIAPLLVETIRKEIRKNNTNGINSKRFVSFVRGNRIPLLSGGMGEGIWYR
eukprot:TRINITY_DN14280_c0_g1_i1.p2 TRINITY_DN14280_c0_g1~~TRINITY_DN14280_c0_g1_i1.p2  ORF type:complete len:132 (-),score=30.05 TRINITY_DN14280_c0_g1_i1:300-695(-)